MKNATIAELIAIVLACMLIKKYSTESFLAVKHLTLHMLAPEIFVAGIHFLFFYVYICNSTLSLSLAC